MNFDLDLLSKAKYWSTLSIIVVLIGWVILATPLVSPGLKDSSWPWLNLGIDFQGGTKITVPFEEKVSTARIREFLSSAEGLSQLGDSQLQSEANSNTVYINTKADVGSNEVLLSDLRSSLAESFAVAEEEISINSVGQQISREFQVKAMQAIGLALLVILLYISWRFRLRYAVGAVAAVVHDVTIALTVFAIFGIEINLPTIGAFLTIVGYSLNDTIVYFDRIRENSGKRAARSESTFSLINKSINQSLSRTLSTSTTTFIPVIALVLFGGPVLKAFSLALLIGVIVGTYSSIYVASPIVYAWDKFLASE
ncbi:protein translocase subunit SecF [Candidatus Bipolaricaulota bacterium]|nr:protein translocase subunit SecF [Candidatus Bipolaricaulota bacterium]MCF7889691.1 protein translocase subunit SecF [Candidatus Bipolaricaulota bacterium]